MSNNRKVIGRLTSRSNGFDTEDLENVKMVARFEHCGEKLSKLLDDKDSKYTKKASKGSHLTFKAYLQERNTQNPATAEKLATVLRKFYAEVRTHLNAICVFRALEIF